jgi:hypothetical protein
MLGKIARTGAHPLKAKTVATALLVLSFGLFLIRGPLRAASSGGGDLGIPYVATLRMLHGQNPYACCGSFEQEWRQAGATRYTMDAGGQHLMYPPSTLVLFVPLALLPWKAAFAVFTALCCLATLAVICRLALYVGESWSDPRRLFMVAFALALAPVHTGIAVGNLSAFTFPLCCIAMLLAAEDLDLFAGTLLAVVLCLKPTAGIAVVAYALLLGRWRLIASMAAVAGGVSALGLLAMQRIDRAWETDYKRNIDFIFAPGGGSSYKETYANSLNLQNPLFALLHNTTATEILTWALTSALALSWIVGYLRVPHSRRRWEWSSAGFWGLLALLPVYQRNYTGGVIVIALVWAFDNLDLLAAKLTVWFSLPFLVPGNNFLYQLAYSDRGRPFERTGAYKAFVMCHMTWCIVAVAWLLLVYCWKTGRPVQSRQNHLGMVARNV